MPAAAFQAGQNGKKMKNGLKEGIERRIFGPPASLFVGYSPLAGMLPPHSLAGSPNLSPRHLLPFTRWLPPGAGRARFAYTARKEYIGTQP